MAITIAIVLASIFCLFALLLLREFHVTTRLRSALLTELVAKQSFLRSRKTLLIWTYVLSTIVWVVFMGWFFLRIAPLT